MCWLPVPTVCPSWRGLRRGRTAPAPPPYWTRHRTGCSGSLTPKKLTDMLTKTQPFRSENYINYIKRCIKSNIICQYEYLTTTAVSESYIPLFIQQVRTVWSIPNPGPNWCFRILYNFVYIASTNSLWIYCIVVTAVSELSNDWPIYLAKLNPCLLRVHRYALRIFHTGLQQVRTVFDYFILK